MGQLYGQYKTPSMMRITPFWLLLTLLSGCSDEKAAPVTVAQTDTTSTPTSPRISDAGSGTLAPAASSLIDISASAVGHYCEVSATLITSLAGFSNHPSAEALLEAKSAWQQTHESLMRIGYLKYLPIDHPALDHIPVVSAPDQDAGKHPSKQQINDCASGKYWIKHRYLVVISTTYNSIRFPALLIPKLILQNKPCGLSFSFLTTCMSPPDFMRQNLCCGVKTANAPSQTF